jgi:hypothetical protein
MNLTEVSVRDIRSRLEKLDQGTVEAHIGRRDLNGQQISAIVIGCLVSVPIATPCGLYIVSR